MKPFFILIFLFIVGHISAQNVTYAYDSSGNRTSRVISLLRSDTSESSSEGTTFFEDILSERTIKIYPNPTKGQLKVEISDFDKCNSVNLVILNMQGQVILKNKMNSTVCELDISNAANGVYLLHINIDGEDSSWKVIKE